MARYRTNPQIMATRTMIIGIGGASCSGKTTLAKHLVNILPRCTLLHQDDYAPPEDKIPLHPIHGVKDWDRPDTAIEWPRFREELKRVKEGDDLSDSKRSHEHLNLLTDLPISEQVTKKWQDSFGAGKAKNIRYVLVDGFLMFYDKEVYDLLDVRILIRSDKATLEQRRSARNERIADDSFWKDPPNIFEKVVWPAYSEAHAMHFQNGDVEHGSLKEGQEMVLLEEREMDMQSMVERTCEVILGEAEKE